MASSFIKIGFITTGLILSLSSTTSFAKEYYKWVDAKGSTHYTTTPPPKSAMKKKGKVNTYGATASTSHSMHENADKETQNAAAKEAQATANATAKEAQATANAAQAVEAPSTPMKKPSAVSATQRVD